MMARLLMGSGLVCVAGLALFALACVRGVKTATPAPSVETPPVVSRAFGDVLVHAVRTGWVSVKEAHRTLSGAEALRLPAILADSRWTEWMPVTVYVIEHPEGVWLVDAGLSEATLDPEHFACDPGTRFVYSNLLRFRFTPEDRIDRRLAALGVPLERVRGVVFTHRHADHTDAVDVLPDSVTAYVGAGDWPTHNGALPCRWPGGRAPTLVAETGAPFGAFPHSLPLTQDGRLRVVPLRGHSPGHLGVLLESAGTHALFAGDSAFSVEQVRTRTIAGISELPGLARTSLERIGDQLQRFPTFLLPAHDPLAVQRLERGEPTRF
jgi:glyoxylase-like metal-dependent hydrolase (beta-lactamase superfamily II)